MVTLIDSPNDKAITVEIPGIPALQTISRLCFAKNPYHRNESMPALQSTMQVISLGLAEVAERFMAVDRIDVFNRASGKGGEKTLHASFILNSLFAHNEQLRRNLLGCIQENPGEIFDIDEETAVEELEEIAPFPLVFKKGGKIPGSIETSAYKFFMGDGLAAKLQKDGGEIITTDISVDAQSGEVNIDYVLVGSCTGCGDLLGKPNSTINAGLASLKNGLKELLDRETINPTLQEIDTPSAFFMR